MLHYLPSVVPQTAYRYLLPLFLLFAGAHANAQGSCLSVCLSTANAQPGDTIPVQVRVNGFKQILSYAFSLEWSPAQLQYIKYSNAGSALNSQLFNPQASNQGVFRTLWYDDFLNGVNLTDSSLLFTLYFKVLASADGFYPVKINPDSYPTAYEFVDADTNTFPLSNVIGGARIGAASTLNICRLCVESPSCIGNFGSIQCSVAGGTAPYSYQWTGPNNFHSEAANPGMLQSGDYTLTTTDAAGAKAMAQIRFTGGKAVMNAYHNTQHAVCDAANGCANVFAIGGTGPYSIQWSLPGSNAFSRCDLAKGSYSITISDSKGCVATDTFSIAKDSLIEVTAQVTHADCRFDTKGNIQLHSTGTAPFQYQWSNGASGAQLDDLPIGRYAVTVLDSRGCIGKTSTEVKDYGTFDWNFYSTYYCNWGNEATSLKLQGYALAQRTVFPLTVAWDNGTRQEVATPNEELLYQEISTPRQLPGAQYQVTITDAEGCSFIHTTYPQCDKNLQENVEGNARFFIVDYDEGGRVTVYGKHIGGLKQIRFSLYWDNSRMQLENVKTTGSWLPLLKDTNFTYYPNEGRLDFHYNSYSSWGLSSFSQTPLFDVNFTGGANYVKVDFRSFPDAPIALIYRDDTPKAFIGRGGTINFGNSSTYKPYDFDVIPPSCANNGYARIQLTGTNGYGNAYANIVANHQFYYLSNLPTIPPAELQYAQPGYLEFFSTVSGNYTVNIPSTYAPFPGRCSWPGDGDNNGAVNHFDLLYAGLGMSVGKKIQASTFVPGQWTGADENDWLDETPKSHINYKHLDFDGSGMITAADTMALIEYWAKRVDPHSQAHPFVMPTPDSIATQNGIAFVPLADTLQANQLFRIPLSLSADNVLGVAFSISYDRELMDSTLLRFEPAASWLGTPESNLIQVQKNFYGQSRLDIALTRIDQNNSAGAGIIGYLVGRFNAPATTAPLKTMLFVSNTLTINTAEEKVLWAESRKGLTLVQNAGLFSATLEATDLEGLRLSPNPVAEQLTIESAGGPIERIEMYRSDARLLLDLQPEFPEKTARIDVSVYPRGVYFAKIHRDGQLIMRPFVVVGR